MTKKEFNEKFPDVKVYEQNFKYEPIPVDQVKEIRDVEEADDLFKKGWILIATFTNTQQFVAILGRKC